jgi:hypothetical protein
MESKSEESIKSEIMLLEYEEQLIEKTLDNLRTELIKIRVQEANERKHA